MKLSSFIYFANFGIKTILFKKKEPILGTIIVTDKCNLKCKHCSVNNVTAIIHPYSQIRKEMQQLYDMGIRILFFCGGETFLWKDGTRCLRDLVIEAKEMGFFPSLSEIRSNGFPEETAWLAEQLKQPEFLAAMKEEYRGFMIAHDADRSLLRFHYHKLDGIEKRLNELDAPVREYQSDMMQMPLVRQFITDDEVNADLTRGSGFAGGKRRIYEY